MTGFILALLLVASMHTSPSVSAFTDDTYPSLGSARIVIAQDAQRMLIYDGDELLRSMPISTGWPGKRQTLTPAWRGEVGEYWGTFASFGTIQDDGYWLFTDYLPDGRWNGDILIHGAPYLLGPEGQKEYDLEGIGIAPVSHGCIRLLPIDMAWFRRWDPQGVAVEILPFGEPTLTAPRLALGALLAGAASPRDASDSLVGIAGRGTTTLVSSPCARVTRTRQGREVIAGGGSRSDWCRPACGECLP